MGLMPCMSLTALAVDTDNATTQEKVAKGFDEGGTVKLDSVLSRPKRLRLQKERLSRLTSCQQHGCDRGAGGER